MKKDCKYFKYACFVFPPLGILTLGLIGIGFATSKLLEFDSEKFHKGYKKC